MLKEFREFAMRGNVLDMAVGVVIGTAFGAIAKSLVTDVIMPPFGLVLGDVDFSRLVWTIREAKTAGGEIVRPAVTINYGVFLETVASFVVIAFALFLMMRQINRLKKTPPPPPPTTKKCGYCASDIPLAAVRCPLCTSELPANP